MKKVVTCSLFLMVFVHYSCLAKDECKQLKTCADFVGLLTGTKYQLGNFEKRSLRLDKGLALTAGNADQLFSYILEQNNFFRIKTPEGLLS